MLIGLAGYAGVGKSSIAQALAKVNHYPIHSFAAKLKAKVDPLFPKNATKGQKRDTYVAYGRGMRAIESDCWIKELSRALVLSEPSAIIDDVRYANEIAWIKSKGGVVFLIQRNGYGPANEEERESFAEIAAQYPKLPIIPNNGSIEAARDLIFAILGKK